MKMAKTKEMVGKRFGRLVVEKRSERKVKNKGAFWVCKCDCGNETLCAGYKLRSGNTTI